jgi:transcriptional regulator with XRE-family HTH domain
VDTGRDSQDPADPGSARTTLPGIRRGILRRMARDTRLGEFLQARRAQISPEAAGIAPYGRRRVPGLRREELAQLAGVSVDYYVRLEQGRAAHPSPEVLDAIARALQLDEVERAHMHQLATPSPARRRSPATERVAPGLAQLLAALETVPAIVIGRRMDILAWNRLAAALMGASGWLKPDRPNLARMMFLDPACRDLYADWDRHARETVGFLRHSAGRHPDDPGLAALVGELSVKSEPFARWWADHLVREKASGTKRYQHPIVGELTLNFETLVPPGAPDQAMITYVAEPGSPSETSLRLLASWSATEERVATP